MYKKTAFAVFAALAVTALSAIQPVASDSTLNIRRPEAPVPTTTAGEAGYTSAIPLPILVPRSRSGEVAQPATAAIVAADKRPVAQFTTSPAGVRSVFVTYFPQATEPQDRLAFQILASVRQDIGGQTVWVTTTRPSTALSQKQLALGNKTVTLRNGTTAYTITNGPPSTPNAVVWAKDDLIITVASTLPISQVQDLAAQVVVKQG